MDDLPCCVSCVRHHRGVRSVTSFAQLNSWLASVRYGILDNVTYDWHACATAMLRTDGKAVTVSDAEIVTAYVAGRVWSVGWLVIVCVRFCVVVCRTRTFGGLSFFAHPDSSSIGLVEQCVHGCTARTHTRVCGSCALVRFDELHRRNVTACHTGAVSLAGAVHEQAGQRGNFNDVVLVTGERRVG